MRWQIQPWNYIERTMLHHLHLNHANMRIHDFGIENSTLSSSTDGWTADKSIKKKKKKEWTMEGRVKGKKKAVNGLAWSVCIITGACRWSTPCSITCYFHLNKHQYFPKNPKPRNLPTDPGADQTKEIGGYMAPPCMALYGF